MQKKGFTLVELAIVLVVIGILAALGTNGRSLFESSKIKREGGIYNKMNLAWNNYYEVHLNYPPQYTDGSGFMLFAMQPFFNENIIAELETESKLESINYNIGVFLDNNQLRARYDIRGTYAIAITPAERNPTLLLNTERASTAMKYYNYCRIQKMLDNDNHTTGNIRLLFGEALNRPCNEAAAGTAKFGIIIGNTAQSAN